MCERVRERDREREKETERERRRKKEKEVRVREKKAKVTRLNFKSVRTYLSCSVHRNYANSEFLMHSRTFSFFFFFFFCVALSFVITIFGQIFIFFILFLIVGVLLK